MSIRKQFKLLVIFIIAIPVICTTFLLVQNYLHSSKRFILKGYKAIENVEDENDDYADGIKLLSVIPNSVEATLIATETSEIICNTMPELEGKETIHQFWPILEKTYKEYYYQFTSPKTSKETLLITRIPRTQQHLSPSEKIITTLLLLFTIGIVISIISIFYISKTISNSIIEIKNKTKEIANGDLNKEIKIDPSIKKQNEIMSILESLEIMRQSLCEAENRKSNFIMGISHDLRTPVAIIKGYTQAITDGVISNKEDIDNAINLISAKTEQLEAMIEDLISFTKLNNYELKEQLVIESITDLLKYFAKEAKLSANVIKREIICDIDLQENILIPLNKKLILRALQNIFVNAIRYTKDGDKIFINAKRKNKVIIFEIKDTGIGINKQDLPHIFDLFYRSSSSRREHSMGIGLAVVKNVLDAHGWTISVNSTSNVGTSFKIKIPVIEEI